MKMPATHLSRPEERARWLIGEFTVRWGMLVSNVQHDVYHLQNRVGIQHTDIEEPKEYFSELLKQWRKFVLRQPAFSGAISPQLELEQFVTSLNGLAGVRNMLSHGYVVNISTHDGILDIYYRNRHEKKQKHYELPLDQFELLVRQLLFVQHLIMAFSRYDAPEDRSKSLQSYYTYFSLFPGQKLPSSNHEY